MVIGLIAILGQTHGLSEREGQVEVILITKEGSLGSGLVQSDHLAAHEGEVGARLQYHHVGGQGLGKDMLRLSGGVTVVEAVVGCGVSQIHKLHDIAFVHRIIGPLEIEGLT